MQIKKESLVPTGKGTFFHITYFFLFVLTVMASVSVCQSQIWEDFTVRYDGNGADNGYISDETYESGTNDITLKDNISSSDGTDVPFTKNGCNFIGWSLDPENISVITPILPGGTVWEPVDVPITWSDELSGFIFYARWDCGPDYTPSPISSTPIPSPMSTATSIDPTPTATPQLLIAPDEENGPVETIVPGPHKATPTESLLIFPDNRGRKIGKEGDISEYEEKTAGSLISGSLNSSKDSFSESVRIPKLFSASNSELTALPETGITSPAGFLQNRMPSSVSYKPVKMELMIPSLDIISTIVSVEMEENGYPVQWLDMNTGLLSGSSLPGEGFSILAGHNTLDADTFGPFALIRFLRNGDRLFIRTEENELMLFEVYSNEKINEFDYEALYQTGAMYENTITLLTCEDERPEGGYTNRRIVSARKIE